MRKHTAGGPGPASTSRRSRQDDEQEERRAPSAPRSPDALASLQRAVGNRAVVRALTGRAVPAVQRWAWVGATQVQPSDPRLDAATKAMAADAVVRDYHTMAEFKAHAAGTTDYIGNLPASSSSQGTWVRFAPTGTTNLLGEDHTKVTMEDVAAAVGTRSFIYEPFATDDLRKLPEMKAAYEAENAATFASFGVAAEPDKRQFGGESLFPKIAYAFTLLMPYLDGTQPVADIATGNYVGKPMQRYLKIAWGYAADVAARRAAKKKLSAADKALAAVHAATTADLDAFITALAVDGFLGDVLLTPVGKAKLPNLATLCGAVIASMTARMTSDATLSRKEREGLKRMPTGTEAEKMAAFGKWRNLYFSRATRAAVARGVRYAGMGRAHLTYLETEGLPSRSQGYDMTGKDINAFVRLTALRAASAKTP